MAEQDASIPPPATDSSTQRVLGALLGPQRLGITIGRELEDFGVHGRVAAITAGWQEREAEDEELDAAIGHRSVNLHLHARSEEVFTEDPELFRAHREKQDLVRQMQTFHRVQLQHAVQAASDLLALAVKEPLAEPEVEEVFHYLQDVDAHHLARVTAIQDEFEATVRLEDREAVARHREEIAAIVAGCDATAIAGGHVALLLNRLRLFRLAPILRTRPLFAWSAGAMAVTDRVVVFHDHPPQGRGNAEVVAPGLGLYPGLIVLPHAKRRLDLTTRTRVMLLARRFAPAVCVTLDEEVGIRFRADGVTGFGPPTRLLVGGELEDFASDGGRA